MPSKKLKLNIALTVVPFFVFTIAGFSQLVINEVAAHKENNDIEHTYSDWIEVYNNSEDPVDLGQYFLSDNTTNTQKWLIPSEILAPNERMTFFASGKNRRYRIRHWETIIYGDETWEYILPLTEPDGDWNELDANTDGWLSGSGGIGYGDGDDNTIIGTTLSMYMRQEFSILDTSAFAALVLHADYDDAFVAYLNGVEIARSWNITGAPPAYNTSLEGGHEAEVYQGGFPETHYIPKKFYQDFIVPGNNVLSIQVHNETAQSSDLSSNFTLSMGATEDDFTYGPVPVWFYMPESYYHTNFKISPGEAIIISDSQGVSIDQLVVHPDLTFQQSQGRSPDGNADLCIFSPPSFDATNNDSWCYDGIEDKPTATLPSGFYPWIQDVGINAVNPGTTIRFTTNGDDPTELSPIWSGDLQIPATSVLSLKAFGDGNTIPSAVADYTYLIDEDNEGLSVISIITDSLNLWDWNSGIYVDGPNAQFWYPYFGSNFWEPWSKWSRLEYFDTEGIKRAETTLDLEIHGGWSRAEAQKSFRFDMKSIYDGNLDWPMIPDKPYITAFNNLNIRNGGQHVTGSKIQDAFINRLMRETHIDYCAYEPTIVYVNGDFFGLFGIREKIDEHYIQDNYLINSNEVDLKNSWTVLAGSDAHFGSSTATLFNANANDDGFYELADSFFDLENYVDYFIIETYGQNLDWLGIGWGVNNVKLWRPQTDDGRWRYVLYDTDACFGYFGVSAFENYLESALNPTAPNTHSELFAKFLGNDRFRHYFVNRYADLINTIFQPEQFDDLLYEMQESIVDIMPAQIDRWQLPNNWSDWINNVNNISNHNDLRVNTAREHINATLGLNGQEIIELNTMPAGSGRIKISTITPDEYPWTGIYFDGCPVQITAIPNPGYEFSHWMPNAIWDENNQNVSVLENVGQYTQFIAVFEGVAVDAEIRISELNYHSHLSHDSGDWIELHNNSEVEVDLSDWVVSDIYATMSFTIPMGTVIPANDYLVLVANEAKFTTQYSITNFIGQLDFDLDNGGEYLVLKDHFGNVALEFTYNDNSSWPQGCDGFGRTLEKEDNNVYNDPEGWYDGCMFGSPGEAFSPCTDALVISEIHYHPQDELNPGDWLEIVNLSSETLDISGWIFSDSNPLNDYVIDDNTSLESGQRLILAQSPEMFNEIYACYGDVEVQGPFNFGLSNSGEMLTLNTNDALLAYSCYYDDAAGWPQSPDGDGPSLELDELTMPPNASNWFAGCPQGSPGVSYDPDCLSGITVTIIQDGNTLSGEAIGGTGNYTYAWYVDNVLVGTGNEIDILITGDYILVATDENGCQGASTTGQFVSMDEIAFQSIQISPNPATRLAVVQLHQISNGIASLVDLRGKIVWSMNFNTSRIEVPRGQLAAGVYSLRIETKEEILQLQFVFE